MRGWRSGRSPVERKIHTLTSGTTKILQKLVCRGNFQRGLRDPYVEGAPALHFGGRSPSTLRHTSCGPGFAGWRRSTLWPGGQPLHASPCKLWSRPHSLKSEVWRCWAPHQSAEGRRQAGTAPQFERLNVDGRCPPEGGAGAPSLCGS